MAQSLNLTIDQGSDFLVNLTVTDDSGTAYNLTEWTANSSFKKHHTASTYHDFNSEVVVASTGNLNLVLPGSTSATIPSGRYYYDVVLKSNANTAVKRVLQGTVKIDPKVSR
tara:strand:- start:446 stop:781 length:336 start_codon:yes stop_codon:yes gene_type:complete